MSLPCAICNLQVRLQHEQVRIGLLDLVMELGVSFLRPCVDALETAERTAFRRSDYSGTRKPDQCVCSLSLTLQCPFEKSHMHHPGPGAVKPKETPVCNPIVFAMAAILGGL